MLSSCIAICHEKRSRIMKNIILLAALCLVFCGGCSSQPSSVEGGTSGTLVAGDYPVPDFEIKVFEVGNSVPLGMGTTANDGKFQLILMKGEGPLWLEPGEYAITLESIGPETPRIPSSYADHSKTPLKVTWKSEDKSLELKIPAFK